MFLFALLLVGYAVADLEEAPYTVLKEHEGWEERMYPATKWVSIDATDTDVHNGDVHSQVFYKLFNYIDGGNAEGMKIPMTSPVTYKITPGPEGPNSAMDFTMSFLIPMDLQENPPMPEDDLIYIEERPEMMMAAKRFGGFATHDSQFSEQALELYELAMGDGIELPTVPLWTAGYDGPNVIFNRRNEVMFEMNGMN